jgi:PAS domain S-box-containing protein
MLGFAFLGATLFNVSMFLEHASPYYWQPYNLKNLITPFLMAIGISIVIISFLLFAYHFPRFYEDKRREYKAAILFAVFANLGTFGLTLYNSIYLQRMQSNFKFELSYYYILAGSIGIQFLFVIFLLIRKTIRISTRDSRSIWRKLSKPLGRDARATRALATVLLLPLVAIIVYVLRFFGFLPPIESIYLVWYVFLLFYFSFIVIYLNNTEERTTFQVKLVFSALVVMLGIMALVALIVGRSYEGDYVNENLISDHQTINFAPNHYKSYDITTAPFRFDSDMGLKTRINYGESKRTELKFSFPFFSGEYSTIHILSGPMIYLGEEIREKGWGGYHPQPVIAPIIMNLNPSAGGEIFLKNEIDRVTITWYELPEFKQPSTNTIQLILNRDGSFNFSYKELNPDPRNRSIKIDVHTTVNITGTVLGRGVMKGVSFEPRLVGIHPGGNNTLLQPIRFMNDLPYSSTYPGAIFEAYDIDYYQYIHNRLVLLASVLVGSSIFILYFFPVLFRANLIKPLHILYEGMEKVNKGDLDVTISPQFNDEIGFLSHSFNQMLQSVKRAESNFRTLAENAQDGILIISESGIPIYANNRASEISGFSNSDLMKISFNELVRIETDDKLKEQYRPQPEKKNILKPYETSIKTKSGEGVLVELTVSQTIWHGKSAKVAVIRDITERKRSEEKARQQQQQIMKMDKLTSLGTLVAGVAHEINNPNQTILSNASFLLRASPEILSILSEYKDDNEDFLIAGLNYEEFQKSFSKLIAGIEGCSNRIDGIINGLKTYSRDEPVKFSTSLDINVIIQTAIELTENFIKKATKNFTLQLGKNIPKIKGSVQRLEQVLINLILNACQSLTSREQAITIYSSYDRKQSFALITVHDEGVGIPEEHLEKIKEPFFTTKRALGGTGLGLYVSEFIVREHNGTLSFDSVQGKGTVATISMPVEEN